MKIKMKIEQALKELYEIREEMAKQSIKIVEESSKRIKRKKAQIQASQGILCPIEIAFMEKELGEMVEEEERLKTLDFNLYFVERTIDLLEKNS